MQGKNRHFRRSHLSKAKFRVIIRSFALDLPASKIAELNDVSRPTINQLLLKLRIGVAQVCDASSPFSGEVEVDESYFGARHVCGRRVVEQAVKRLSSGSWNGNEKSTSRSSQLPPKSSHRLRSGARYPCSIIHSDGWRGYNGLVDMGYKKHFRMYHGENVFARGNFLYQWHIESFWSYAKRELVKFNGVPRQTFHLHRKECEFRF